MKVFKFTLQSLLNVKNTMEKQQKAELAAANARLAALRQELEVILLDLAGQKTEYFRALNGGELTPSDLQMWSVGFKVMRERINLQKKKIETAEGEQRRAQRKVIETMKERKMLEKLKERQLAEYRIAQAAEDAAAVDEFLSAKIHMEG
ncbi:MAG: flagellar export protein FliJ [Oscillospiraceae bacterium]|jgi:flagellar FliJ protein|nr:flagellar export protein FliJ [Oscillospiraceae bacterium]